MPQVPGPTREQLVELWRTSGGQPLPAVPRPGRRIVYFIPSSMLETEKSALNLTVTLLSSAFVMCAS
jgi:hypothetical protein